MAEKFQDDLIDRKLKISTCGRDESLADDHHLPYEATEYQVLDLLVEEGYVQADDFLIDYGCGKGRVPIYLHHLVGCRATGVEMSEELYQVANENLKAYKSDKVSFFHGQAEHFKLSDEETCFFFFNPFSVEILRSVIEKIVLSYYTNPREIKLFFYFPTEEYVGYLMGVDELSFYDEIDCMDFFEKKDGRNRVLVFQMMI